MSKLAYLLLLLGAFPSTPLHAFDPDLQAFLQTPPRIASLFARAQYGTNVLFFEWRWQPGSYFFRTASSMAGLTNGVLEPGAVAVGGHHGTLWSITQSRGLIVDTLPQIGKRGDHYSLPRDITGRTALFPALALMNLGSGRQIVGNNIFQNDEVVGTNYFNEPFRGRTEPPGSKAQKIQYARIGKNGSYQASVELEYGEAFEGWSAPTLIRMGEQQTEVIDVQLAAKEIPGEHFLYYSFANERTGLRNYTERTDGVPRLEASYQDQVHGYRKIAGRWVKRAHLSSLFFCGIGLLTCVAVVVARSIAQKQRKKP